MIVVADASPLNYLIQINCDWLLQQLFGRVLVPKAVIEELRHPSAPAAVSHWLLHIPSWTEIRTAIPQEDRSLDRLGEGEREAIFLAQQEQADLLLIDEKQGRREAERRRIPTTGTLGVIARAAQLKLIDSEAAFSQLLSQTTFRATKQLREAFIRMCERRQT